MSSFFARAYSTFFSSTRNRSSSSGSSSSASIAHKSTSTTTSTSSSLSSSFSRKDENSSLFRKTANCGPLSQSSPHTNPQVTTTTIQDKEDECRRPTSVGCGHIDDCQARLLREFSRSTCSTILIQEEECILCLGEFSNENPQICTLCSCGENRTKFHYPCLLMWLEKKPVCPTCDSSIFYQEGIYHPVEE